MSETEAVESVIAYLEASVAANAKGKWAKGYRQACADHVAVLKLALAAIEGD